MEKIERLEKDLAIKPQSVPRLFTSDATPEAAAVLAADNEGVVNVIDDEGVFLANMAGRYANSPNYDLCLKGHTGEGYTIDRVKRGAIHIPHVFMVLGIASSARYSAIAHGQPHRQRCRFPPSLPDFLSGVHVGQSALYGP